MISSDVHNVDASEVAYFQKLAHQWWNANGPWWPLHRLNALRSDFLRERLCAHFALDVAALEPLAGLHILDVGCGGGLLSESMARLGATVHGIDVVEKSITIASHHARACELDVSYECTTAATHAKQAQGRYQVVLNMEVVEHVPEAGALIEQCSTLLAPNGVMAVATINRTLKSWLFAIVGAEYIMRWLPRGTHQWQKLVTPEELERYLRRCDLTPMATQGVMVNPITRKFSLTSNVDVNYMILAASQSLENTLADARTPRMSQS